MVLENVIVNENFRRQGVGIQMVKHMENALESEIATILC